MKIYLFQMTCYHPCGTYYWDKAFSLHACAADQFYFTTLAWSREISPVKQIAHVAIAKTYTRMKARDVKNENQMKSKFFRGNLSTLRKGELSFFISLYKIFICCLKESRNSFARKFGRRIILHYCKKRKVNHTRKNKSVNTL